MHTNGVKTNSLSALDANDKYFVRQIICLPRLELFGMIEERLRSLVRYIGATKLASVTTIERRRWQTVATNKEVKARVEDMEALLKAFPQYELWLWKGEVDPDNGQVAPSHEASQAN